MAKKAKPASAQEKKRKGQTVAPREQKEGEVRGTVGVSVHAAITLPGVTGVWDELVIEWGCLGLSEEPDHIVETSGNNIMLDPDRPITTSEEGMHLFFKPPLAAGGAYGFNFLCTYILAAEARAAKEEEEAA
jgi:hypothetical protein